MAEGVKTISHFREPVYAPCAGHVVARTEDRACPNGILPNMTAQHPAGNFVLLECGESDVLLRDSCRPA